MDFDCSYVMKHLDHLQYPLLDRSNKLSRWRYFALLIPSYFLYTPSAKVHMLLRFIRQIAFCILLLYILRLPRFAPSALNSSGLLSQSYLPKCVHWVLFALLDASSDGVPGRYTTSFTIEIPTLICYSICLFYHIYSRQN